MGTGGVPLQRLQRFMMGAACDRLLASITAVALLVAACAPPPTGAPAGGVSAAPIEATALPTATPTTAPLPSPTPTSTSTPTPTPSPTPPPPITYPVTKVVTADTFQVTVEGRTETLRLIGVLAPQASDPQRPAECFGREATAVARALLEGKRVQVQGDVTQGGRDAAGRVLVYVWLPDGSFYNEVIIREGYAIEQTVAEPYRYQANLLEAQRLARENGKGLWSPKTCNGLRPQPATQPTTTAQPEASKPGTNCDSSYPGVCIPPPPPVLTCLQIPARKFKVVPPDPHRLDPDGNGTGCE